MKKATKVLVSVLIIASMCLSLTSCFGAAKAVKEAAADFMEAALARDIEEMADLCTDDDEAYALLRSYEAEFEPVDALLSRAEVKIGKVTVKKDKASVEITVIFPDYEAVLDEEPEDIDEFEDLLDDQKKTTELTLTLDLKQKKDEWLIDSYEDFGEDFYDELNDIEFGFASPYAGWVDHHNWYGSDNDVYYSDRSSLNLELYINNEHYNDNIRFYFKVFQGTSLIYTSPTETDSGFIDNYCRRSDLNINSWDAGSYTFVFYDENGAEWYRATCTVA